MAIYRYVKEQPQRFRKLFSIFSTLLVFSGLSLIGWVAYPIIAFELFYAPRFISLVRPYPETIVAEAMENRILGAHADIIDPAQAGVDYTKASNWFPKASPLSQNVPASVYTVSIPKLNIQNAETMIGSEDLNKSLIHWGGSALPGEYGIMTVFGHSTIPWLYNPKDYHTIFSKLPELTRGDDIYFTIKNVTYRYQVEDMRVIAPEDTSILEQKYDDAYAQLITCVPPGTYAKRLVVKARLVKFQ
jgi:sortase A